MYYCAGLTAQGQLWKCHKYINTQTQHSYATDTKGTQESENLVSANSPSCYKVITNVCETGHICTANVKSILGNWVFFQAFRRLCTPVKKKILVVIVWLTSEKGAWDVFPPSVLSLVKFSNKFTLFTNIVVYVSLFPKGSWAVESDSKLKKLAGAVKAP